MMFKQFKVSKQWLPKHSQDKLKIQVILSKITMRKEITDFPNNK
jgi:hypothetical protein